MGRGGWDSVPVNCFVLSSPFPTELSAALLRLLRRRWSGLVFDLQRSEVGSRRQPERPRVSQPSRTHRKLSDGKLL